MSVTKFYVGASADDGITGTESNTTSTSLRPEFNNAEGEDSTLNDAFAYIDTSGIPDGDTITAATLYWYHASYTYTDYIRRIISIGGSTPIIFDVTGPAGSAGWHSHELEASELGYINKSGKTNFWFTVDHELGAGELQLWALRSYNYSGNAHGPYLEVTHSSGGPTKVSILGV